MMESNTQGHGTIKKLRTGAVISTLAISAFGVANGVSASETEVAVNEPATKVVAQDEVVPKVPSQSDVDKAKAESDKANQDVAKQKEVVASTEANIANTEKTIADTTKKVEEAKSVTPEKVTEAKADADKKDSELATAEKTVADADKSVSTTAEKVADQTKVVSNAEKTATDTANKVSDAQKKVDSLSSSTKDTHELEKDVYTLTVKIRVDERKVDEAQKKLDDGKKAIADRDQAIKDTQSLVTSAEAKFKQATIDRNNAEATLSEKEDALKKAKSALDVAKQGVTKTTTVSETEYRLLSANKKTPYKVGYSPALSQGYIDAIKALANGTGTADAVRKAALKTPYMDEETGVGAKSLKDFNSTGELNGVPYGSEDKDATEIADFQHLTKEQQIQLATYAASIINELRAKVGTQPVKVSDSSLKLAEAFNNYTNAFTSANSGEYSQHNTKGIKEKYELAKKESNVTVPSLAIRSKMIPDFLGLGKKVTTMAQVKQVMYQGIVNALMGVNENTSSEERYSSALSLLGLRDADKTNLGVGIGYLGSYTTKGYEASITLSAPQSTTTTTQKVDEKAVEAAQKAYVNAYQEVKDAENAVYLAKTKYSQADFALDSARSHLSNIRMNKIDVPALEKALEEAKAQLAEDKQALKIAEEVLELAKLNANNKSKALAEAKTALKTAKEEKVSADRALETAKGELEVLTKAHDVAVLARKSAGEDLDRKREASKEATDTYTVLELALTKRNEVLKALDKELADAKSKLGVLRAELETAKEELTRLEGIAEVKARGYENFKQLKAEHDAYLAEQQRLQALKDKADAIRKAGGQPKEVTDSTGKVVDVVDAKAQNKVVVATVGTKDDKTYQAPAQATNAKAEPKKQLPNTGEKRTNTATLAIVTALSSIGLVYCKRKKSQ